MLSTQTINKKERMSFFVDRKLAVKIGELSKQTKLTVSEITRRALQNYIDQSEKERIEKELAEGYEANYKYYLNSNNEWEHADKE